MPDLFKMVDGFLDRLGLSQEGKRTCYLAFVAYWLASLTATLYLPYWALTRFPH